MMKQKEEVLKNRERISLIKRIVEQSGGRLTEEKIKVLRRIEDKIKELDDAEFANLIKEINPRPSIFFYGQYYTLEDGVLNLTDSSENVRGKVREALKRWQDRAYYILLAASMIKRSFTEKELADKMSKLDFPYLQHSLLGWLESLRLIMRTSDGKWIVPEEILPAMKKELADYEPKLKLRSTLARRELEEVMRMEKEFEDFLRPLIKERLDQVLSFGENFSVSKLVEYLRSLFGPVLYYDILLTMTQQYSIADVNVVTEEGGARMRTGFNLALFGEPGTGKTFSTYTMIMGDPNKGIPAHGLPGRNRYCGGMTPAKFIRIGEAYEGRKYNFIITEFNDWFKYSGMVEPLKIAMEHGIIKWETARQTIGPYRFTSFLSVNYNTRVFKRGYEVTVKDPNFSAIEERMLCRLHRLTKERYREIAEKQMELVLGKLKMEKAREIRDHLTLIHAIETEHPLVKDQFKPKPVLLAERVFEEITRAREAILDTIEQERLDFSPRLERRAIQLICAMSLMSYFREEEERIRVDSDAMKLGIRFYVEEAAVRSKEKFSPEDVLRKLNLL